MQLPKKINDTTVALIIALVAAILFIPFLGAAHLFDWDEINFAECAREMIITGNYTQPQINFQPFWEKPPLFIWFQVLSMKAFGINEFAARFPNAICGICSLITVFFVGRKITKSQRFGILWAVCFGASLLPHIYFKSGIIDPWFNFFIFLSLVYMHQTVIAHQKIYSSIAVAALFCGLALLTKGPVALLMIGLTFTIAFFILSNKNSFGEKLKTYFKIIIPFTVLSLLVAGLWFGDDLIHHGGWFTKTFLVYNLRLAQTQDAGHGGFIGYHVVVLLLGCFPTSAFAVNELFGIQKNKNAADERQKTFSFLMRVLFWLTLAIFSLVNTKIVHYSSLCYFPLTYLAALSIEKLLQRDAFLRSQKRITIVLLAFVGAVWCFLLVALPVFARLTHERDALFAKDRFALANLQADVLWKQSDSFYGIASAILVLIGITLFVQRSYKPALLFIFGGSLLMAQTIVYIFAPKIEGYSQRAAIEFYQQSKNKNVVIEPYGFRSYAHLFYSEKKPVAAQNYDLKMLDTVFVAKITTQPDFKNDATFEVMQQKNGFVFFKKRSHQTIK